MLQENAQQIQTVKPQEAKLLKEELPRNEAVWGGSGQEFFEENS
jgi:hypothetical protein